MKKAERQQLIERLSSQVVEKAQCCKGGSACLVPSVSEPGRMHRVEVDEQYRVVSCSCQGGRGNCAHKQAVMRYFIPKLPALLDNRSNPRYELYRAGKPVVARLSQFSKEEKQALRAWQQAEEARLRQYTALFDPNNIYGYCA